MADDTTRPTNLPANARPTEGYILTVDGKLKTRYETEQDAAVAGANLKQRFPVIQVSVYDAAKDVHTPVALPEVATSTAPAPTDPAPSS